MPEEYGSLKLKVPKEKGEAPDAPQAFKDFSDSITKPATGGTGQFLIVQSTGSAAYKAMKGDATLAEDGTLTIGAKKVTDSKLGIIRGRIKEDGGVVSGGGFSVEKTATGVYKVTFTSPYVVEPLVFATPYGSFARHATTTIWSEAEATKARRINLYDAEGKAVDGSVQFWALEP